MTPQQLSLFAALTEAKVQYAVVGGVAVNAYGYIRATQDLDIFIRPTIENAKAAFAAFQELGLNLPGDFSDLLTECESLRFGVRPDQVDILNAIGGISFDQVWRNRTEVEVEGVTVPFISKPDLIANKQQVGRLRDLVDADELLRIPDPNPDPKPL